MEMKWQTASPVFVTEPRRWVDRVYWHRLGGVAAFCLAGLLLHGCSSPVYRSEFARNMDRQILFAPGMDLESALLQELERAERGVQVQIRKSDLQDVYRPLQKWIAAIRAAKGEIEDRDRVIVKYDILQAKGAPNELARIKNYLADKTENVFNARNRNRRLYFARRFRMVIDERKEVLNFYFVKRVGAPK